MKITRNDIIIAYLTLISGLTISAVAVWYSVAGLVSIFAAAVTPIIVMGVALEVSKLIATIWLKLNWQRAPILIRTYLCIAIAILMVITSMGIFGFLSKAHSDQSLVSGDVQSKIAVYDDKIKIAKENIDANRKALKQMDEAVDQVMGRSTSETGADKAVNIRKSQQKERARLQAEIQAEQKTISKVSEERAPIAAEVRKVEAEVGPIKYIAAFVYGDNPDANVLEKAVTWVIIIIVSVFDPLAVILLLASQYSFQWFRKAREEEEAEEAVKDWFDQGKERARQLDIEAAEAVNEPKYEQDDGSLTDDQIQQINDMLAEHVVHPEPEIPVIEVEPSNLDAWNNMIAEAEKEAEKDLQTRLATGETYISGEGEETVLPPTEGTVFPEPAVEGQHFTRTDFDPARDFVYNGAEWIDAVKSQAADLERPGDYLTDDESKKKTYIVKEQNHQVKKEKD